MKSFRPSFYAEQIYGGTLLGISGKDFITLYDWEECRVVRKIDVVTKAVKKKAIFEILF